MVLIVWDERKRRVNIDKHGVDFATIDEAFFLASRRFEAREGRFIAIGNLRDGRVILAIYKPLGTEALSISARVRRVVTNGA